MKNLMWAGLLGASTAMIAGCHGSNPVAVNGPVQTMQARLVESREQHVPQTLEFTGTVHARESAVVSAQVMSRIQQVLVHEGDNVHAGQTLAVLDDATLRAQVEQAQAGVKAAQNAQAAAQSNAALAASTLERYRQLQAQKSVSPQEMDEVSRRAEAAVANLDAARAQADAARAQESGARSMMGYTRLVAPFAGVVTARMADPGTMAAPGVPLLQVDRAGALQLQVSVDESAIAAIHKGLKLAVELSGAAFTGSVGEIVPAADPSSHSFLVKIDLPASSQARAGIYGTVEIPSGLRSAILVPRTALVRRGSLMCAYVLNAQGIAQLRAVTLGALQGDLVEVLSGISAGEKLIDDPADRDLAGKRIEKSNGVQP
jgi:RND family efflux transporter MFP subunit